MILIGLNGRASSGKNTAYEIVREHALAQPPGLFVRRDGFADRLKLSALIALGFNPKSADEALELADKLKATSGSIVTTWQDGTKARDAHEAQQDRALYRAPNIKNCLIGGREFLQRYGTEAHRDIFGPDFWIDVLLPRPESENWRSILDMRFPDTDVLMITDLRFSNEAARVLLLNGEIWEIDADERLGERGDAHATEQPLPHGLVTRTIPNNGSLDEFRVGLCQAYDEAVR